MKSNIAPSPRASGRSVPVRVPQDSPLDTAGINDLSVGAAARRLPRPAQRLTVSHKFLGWTPRGLTTYPSVGLPRPAERGEGRGEGPFPVPSPLRPGIDPDTDTDTDPDPNMPLGCRDPPPL
jgi:hypothetical protein